MFRPKLPSAKSVALKPFALRIRDGYLVGLAVDAKEGTPCAGCVQNWLHDRNIEAKPEELSNLNPETRSMLNRLESLQSPHVFYEVMDNGQKNRLDCLVFPHARCDCHKKSFVPPSSNGKVTNLAFSPIFQLKCVRYGTPNGNLWFFTAMGQSPLTMKIIAANGVDPSKEKARQKALDLWLKKATLVELDVRLETGETFLAQELRTNEDTVVASHEELDTSIRLMGAGSNKQEAIIDGLNQLTKQQTLEEYANLGKNPMLIVGSNNWLRGKVPFFLIQQYDLYPLFYPNKSPSWVVGIAAFSRLNSEDKPLFAFGADGNINNALEKAVHQLLHHCRPVDWRNRHTASEDQAKRDKAIKLNLWWTHWVYRCPKISLKDVLQLEGHPLSIESWGEYLAARGDSLTTIEVNSPLLPTELRSLVKLNVLQTGDKPYTRASNVRGIGTWSTIRKAVNPV